MKLKDLVDHIFPSLTIQSMLCEFSDLNFWRQPLPELDLPVEAEAIYEDSSDNDLSSEDEGQVARDY